MNTKQFIKSIVLAAILTFTISSVAQQDPNRAFYRYSMNLINPAYAGAHQGHEGKSGGNNSEIGIDFRSQWSGVQGAPETQSAFFSTGMGKNVGLGVSIINDRTFIENQTTIAVDFSYSLMLSENSQLFLGLKAGGSSYDANLLGLTTFGVGSDPSLNNISGKFNPSIGAGAYLKGKRFFIALSAPNFLSSKRLEEEQGNAQLGQSRTHYYFTAGYDIPFGSSIRFKPSFLTRYIHATPFSIELNAMFSFNNRIELGPTYRINEGAGGILMFNAANWVDLGYAYETASNSPVAAQSNGTHEVFIKLKM